MNDADRILREAFALRDGRAFALLSAAPDAVQEAVLLVQPPGAEHLRCYRWLRELAEQLVRPPAGGAKRQTAVLRLELTGSGNSTERLSSTRRADWLADIAAARAELGRRYPAARLHFVGVRYAARLLLDVLADPTSGAPEQTEKHADSLTFMLPCLSGKDWLADVQAATEAARKEASDGLAEGATGGALGGESWSEELRLELAQESTPGDWRALLPALSQHPSLLLERDSPHANGLENSEINQQLVELSSSDWRVADLPMVTLRGAGDFLSGVLLSDVGQERTSLPAAVQIPRDATDPVAATHPSEPGEAGVWLGQGLFGVYTPGRSPCPPVVLFNSGLLPSAGPYRVYVALARALAHAGIPSLRLDTSGKGESARKDLSRAAALQDDLAQVSDFLRGHGHHQLVLAGICSGADDALELAAGSEDVAGLILLDGYAPRTPGYSRRQRTQRLLRGVRDPSRMLQWLRRQTSDKSRTDESKTDGSKVDDSRTRESTALELRHWEADAVMLERLRALLDRGCTTCAVFTGSLADSYYNDAEQLSRSLSSPPGLVEHYFPHMTHLYPSDAERRVLIDTLLRWLHQQWLAPAGQVAPPNR